MASKTSQALEKDKLQHNQSSSNPNAATMVSLIKVGKHSLRDMEWGYQFGEYFI